MEEMAPPDRQSGRSLERQLLEEGHGFDFYQAVALLEHMARGRIPVGEGADPALESVRFEAPVSFKFPASDVERILPDEDEDQWRMRVTFLSLIGALGPLPNVFGELVQDRLRKKDTAFKAFLDIYIHRLVSLMYRVRAKGRLGFGFKRPEDSAVARYLFSLIGLGTPRLAGRMGVKDRALLNYVGLLIGSRSLPGLETLLSDHFGVPVRVVPYTGRWLTLEQGERTSLGGMNSGLGVDVILGARVWDQQGCFTLQIGPLSLRQYLKLLPTGQRYPSMVALTRFYAGEEFDFQLRLELRNSQIPRTRLRAKHGSRLGWTSWLTTRRADPDAIGETSVPIPVRRGSMI